MKITIEISEKDFGEICNTSMTVGELYETLHGRIYRAIVNGEPQTKEIATKLNKTNTIEIDECHGCPYHQRCTDSWTGRESDCLLQTCIRKTF